jgi:hypothetical protein
MLAENRSESGLDLLRRDGVGGIHGHYSTMYPMTSQGAATRVSARITRRFWRSSSRVSASVWIPTPRLQGSVLFFDIWRGEEPKALSLSKGEERRGAADWECRMMNDECRMMNAECRQRGGARRGMRDETEARRAEG